MIDAARRTTSGAPFLLRRFSPTLRVELFKLAVVAIAAPIVALVFGSLLLGMLRYLPAMMRGDPGAAFFDALGMGAAFAIVGLAGAWELIYIGMAVGMPLLVLLRHFRIRSYTIYAAAGFFGGMLYFSVARYFFGIRPVIELGLPLLFGMPCGLAARFVFGRLDAIPAFQAAVRTGRTTDG